MKLFEILVVADEQELAFTWVRILGDALTDLIGGFSVYQGYGGWKNGAGEVVFEPHFRVQAYCETMSAREVFNHLADTIRLYKENCQQETVLVLLDGKPVFLTEVPDAIALA